MSKGQNPGNLRDFRIDFGESPKDSLTRPVQQELRGRQSGAELWSDWAADEGVEVPLGRAIATPAPRQRPSPAPEAVAPTQEKPTLKSEVTKNLPWAAELAFDERRMESQGVVDFTSVYQKQEVLRHRTLEYMVQLQESFRSHVEIFNESRRSPSHSVHIYRVSNSEGDFMLFRNGVKLVVSGARAGRVLFAFNQYLGQIFAPNQAPVVEIEASWGPFDQLFWSFKNERVQLLDVVRYFLSEFTRQSYK